jgi:IclR family acetate operon transcriptional repressor
MSGVMERTLAILERLARDVRGVPLATLADELDIPRSATHRLLTELAEHGYVRQSRERGDYMLTTKLISLGLNYLKHSGVVDLCQPIMDRLAETAGELVRLGVVDVDHITWVALSQGARSGLRYDPDQGIDAKLSCTSSGHVWLSTMSEDDALTLVSRQGFGKTSEYGPTAPTTPTALLEAIRRAPRAGLRDHGGHLRRRPGGDLHCHHRARPRCGGRAGDFRPVGAADRGAHARAGTGPAGRGIRHRQRQWSVAAV